MLWLFVRDAARLADEQSLLKLASEYQVRYTDRTVWRFVFDPSGHEDLRQLNLQVPDNLPDYNRLFIYGSTCNLPLSYDPEVLALLNPSACNRRLEGIRSPWCRTHQLIGLRFVQRNHCEPGVAMEQAIAGVQNGILTELKWDFRMEDAYIQKVLTLVESGRRQDVKAIWIRKVLDAQRPDGGWNETGVIARLPGGRVICWRGGRLYPWIIRPPESNFHATAQALYLLALLRGSANTVQ